MEDIWSQLKILQSKAAHIDTCIQLKSLLQWLLIEYKKLDTEYPAQYA